MTPRPHPYRPHPMRLRQRDPNPKHIHAFEIKWGITKIESVQDARGCHCLVKCENDTAATIDMVEVTGQGGKPSAFKIVRCILEYYTTNITALKLRLSFEPTSRMLQNLEFINLITFETNIPHAAIAPFLTRHPAITELVLDACNAATAACPLTNCNLSHVERLSCPKGCVWPLLSAVTPASPLCHLQVIQNAPQDSFFPLQNLFNLHPIPTSSHIHILHLDFDHGWQGTPGLLEAISTAAPRLNTLRLAESKFSAKEETSLWDDAYAWRSGLHSFKHLKRLLIRTSRSISTSEGGVEYLPEDEELRLARQRQREDDVVRGWLVSLPKNFREIKIWTKAFAGRTSGERMAVWMLTYNERRGHNQWEVVCNYPITGEEVRSEDFI